MGYTAVIVENFATDKQAKDSRKINILMDQKLRQSKQFTFNLLQMAYLYKYVHTLVHTHIFLCFAAECLKAITL